MSEQMLHLMSSTLPAELCSLRHGWFGERNGAVSAMGCFKTSCLETKIE